MRAFAEQYKPDRLITENPKEVSFETIVENLKENEEVLFAFVASAGSIAKYSICHVGVVLTKNRLLIVYKPNSAVSLVMGANCKAYNLKDINSVGPQGVSLEISIRAEGNIILGNWSPEKRNLLANKIREIVDNCQEVPSASPVVVSNISSADELKKFKDLLDAGIITQEEFDAKKKQLLGL
ncbi:MAG: SHOCT domain-containing protein [Ruminococcaceae bacterium]|nr:SHOCT domain-containing protein [Oscillospiraceae bacterium]